MTSNMVRGWCCLFKPPTSSRRLGKHFKSHKLPRQSIPRAFHASAPALVIKPFILADIGEGIKEVQIIQWFVEPEARVQQFDKLCEVQSDKAATEITSRFDGVIKKLYYEAEDMAQVGKPLCDIDIQSEIAPEDEELLTPPAEQAGTTSGPQQPRKVPEQHDVVESSIESAGPHVTTTTTKPPSKHAALATPAVRGLLKELQVDISNVIGTGKDGRVLKEDVQKFAAQRDAARSNGGTTVAPPEHPSRLAEDAPQQETVIALTHVQSQMFKTMTRSLTIPHFLYADEYDLTALTRLRKTLNAHPSRPVKLSALPFIIKAVSLALTDFPILNARVDTSSSYADTRSGNTTHPKLVLRSNHNIGIATDTPSGLLVPVIKNIAAKSVLTIAAELAELSALAKEGKLSSQQLTGGTFTISNIGSIGGTYVSPIIVSSEVAILGVGRSRIVPAIEGSGSDLSRVGNDPPRIVAKEVGNFSWSADHRVVDGATVARCAERVRSYLEGPGLMAVTGR